jgi:kynurenine formamidase
MSLNAATIMDLLKGMRAYDIAPNFETNMPGYWNNPPCWIIDDVRTYDKDHYFCQTLVLGEHIGAHIDAPAHVHKGAKTIEQFDPGFFIMPYKKYDLTCYDPGEGWMLRLEHIKEIEERDGIKPEPGELILFCYGWDKHYKPESPDPAERAFYGANSPGLSEDACRYFRDAKVKAVGSDTCQGTIPSVNAENLSLACHDSIFLPNNIPIVEGLVNLTQIPLTGLFMALPLNIKHGSGSPVSAVVFG